MTREEEIENALNYYAPRYWVDKGTVMSDEELAISFEAFRRGAKWADAEPNLESIWHDVSEEPRLNQWFIAQIGDDAFDTFVMAKDWRNWSKGLNIKRWAYIGDLLPKGGER